MYWTTREGKKLKKLIDRQMLDAINNAMSRIEEIYADPPDEREDMSNVG